MVSRLKNTSSASEQHQLDSPSWAAAQNTKMLTILESSNNELRGAYDKFPDFFLMGI